MHFSAKRGLVIACRLSVRPSVCLSVCNVGGLWSHIGWNSSEIISPFVSLGCSLSADPNISSLLQGNTRKFWPKVTHPCWFEHRRHSIANCGWMVTDSATVTMESQPIGNYHRSFEWCHRWLPTTPPPQKNGASICPQDTRMAISLQRVIRSTSCLF